MKEGHLDDINVSTKDLVSKDKMTWPQRHQYNIKKQPLQVFYKKGILKNLTKFTGKHLHREDLQAYSKKDLDTGVFL